MPNSNHILLISSPDEKGLVHKITGVLFRSGLNIVSNGEFVDPPAKHFFMRTEFSGEIDAERILGELRAVLPGDPSIQLIAPRPKKIVLLATREPHCLGDLLLRHCYQELNAEILAVFGNYPDLAFLVENLGVAGGTARLETERVLETSKGPPPAGSVGRTERAKAAGIPFFCVRHEGKTREQHEAELLAKIGEFAPEYVVLAKYMRLLTWGFVGRFPNRIVNIHHSFLPAFAGAHPYKQAHERGVKIIGATAHFVTEKLDEGPIIAQSVIPVDHTHGVQELTQAGREIEKLVLAKALKLVFEDRVFVFGNKTIIFE